MLMYENEMNVLMDRIEWTQNSIEEYLAKNEFDPFTTLMNQENKSQKMYVECVNFLAELVKLNEKFGKTRDEIVRS